MVGTTDVGENITSSIYELDYFRQCCSADDNLENTENNIWIYASPCLLLLGTVGNILSGRIMLGKRLRKHTTSVYLIALAVVDTCILYSDMPWSWIHAVFKIDVFNLSLALCKMRIFFIFYTINLQVWILVCVSMERFTAVFLPTKAKRWFTKKKALIQLAIVAAALFALNAHFFWTYTLLDFGSGNVCTEHPDFITFRLNVHSWIDMILNSILPFSFMFLSSIAISVKLYMQSKIGGSGSSKTTTLSSMLITVCVVFILCTLPSKIFLANTRYFLNRYGCCFSWRVIWPLLAVWMYTNNAVNFILYSISGPRFRKELQQMFPCCRKIGVEPSIAQTSTTN